MPSTEKECLFYGEFSEILFGNNLFLSHKNAFGESPIIMSSKSVIASVLQRFKLNVILIVSTEDECPFGEFNVILF